MVFSNHKIEDGFADDKLYFADKKSLSNSMLGVLDESPVKFDLMMKGEWSYPHKQAFDIGSAVHSIYLEGIDNRLLVEGTRRDKTFREHGAANPEKIVFQATDYNLVTAMVDRLQETPELNDFLGQFPEQNPELAATANVTTPKGNVISVKGKADMLLSDGFSTPILMDLKTSAKGITDWKRAAWYYSYPRQAYLYSQLFQVKEFYFAVVTKEWPYEVALLKATPAFIDKGRKMFENSILDYEYLFLEGNYSPSKGIVGTL